MWGHSPALLASEKLPSGIVTTERRRGVKPCDEFDRSENVFSFATVYSKINMFSHAVIPSQHWGDVTILIRLRGLTRSAGVHNVLQHEHCQ